MCEKTDLSGGYEKSLLTPVAEDVVVRIICIGLAKMLLPLANYNPIYISFKIIYCLLSKIIFQRTY